MKLHVIGVAKIQEEYAQETVGYTNPHNVEVLPTKTLPGEIKEAPFITD